MKQYRDAEHDVVILKRGEELISCLNDYAQQADLSGAWLIGGVGGSSQAVLSFYDIETKSYIDKTFNQPLEILSLQGNFATVDGAPRWHVHGVFAGLDYQAIGGHVQSLTVGLTGELYIQPLKNTALIRRFDEPTGLTLID